MNNFPFSNVILHLQVPKSALFISKRTKEHDSLEHKEKMMLDIKCNVILTLLEVECSASAALTVPFHPRLGSTDLRGI